jgi:hypothetical protein
MQFVTMVVDKHEKCRNGRRKCSVSLMMLLACHQNLDVQRKTLPLSLLDIQLCDAAHVVRGW